MFTTRAVEVVNVVRAGYFTHPVVLITMVGGVRASPYRWGCVLTQLLMPAVPPFDEVPVPLSLGAWKQVGRARVVLVSAPPHEGATECP